MATDDSSVYPEEVIRALQTFAVNEVKTQLRGKRLRRVVKQDRAQLVGDYSGGSLVSECSQALSLYYDYTFRLEEKTFRAITGGGISLPSEEVREIHGRWSIDVIDNELYLTLKRYDDIVLNWTIEPQNLTVLYVDGQLWQVENMSA